MSYLNNKFKYIFCGFFAFLVATGCKSTQPTNTPAKEEIAPRDPAKERAETVEDDFQATKYRLIVSFISIGEGPDFNAKSGLDRIVMAWEQKKGVALKQEAFPWGREGEVDYCFHLLELTSNEQLAFIQEITSSLGTSKLVQISENQPCIHKR